MAALLLYSLKSAFVLALLYVPYVLMLRRESFFRFNRAMLLAVLVLSLVLPLCNVSWLSLDRQPVVHAAQMQLLELGVPVTMLDEVEIMGGSGAAAGGLTLFAVLSAIYIIGMCGVLLARMWQMGRLVRGVGRGSLWVERRDGMTVHCQARDVSPFSWMSHVVISRQDYEENGREILLHETGHIRARHSWDVLLLTLVEMLQWWNPLVYMLAISLRDVHEYEADDYVLRQGISARGYQMLVIKKAVGSGSYAFANNFNHSLTLKRITMMCKKSKSSAWMRARALYVIPAAALALSVFATPKIVSPVEGAVNNLAGKGTENSADLQVSDGKTTRQIRQVTAEEMKDMVLQRYSAQELEEMGMHSVAQWLREDVDGIPRDTTVFKKPYKIAAYPGGDMELMKFMSENMKYPKLCQEFGLQGRLHVEFVVETDGSISNLRKLRGPGMKLTQADVAAFKKDHPDATDAPRAGLDLGQLLEAEAIRVLKLMPRWTPAQNEKGELVRSTFVIPVIFKLN